ncbi:MAG: hypothetical protein QMC89_02860 [Candidatus Hodarchaeaceae archaeon]|nr:hypothetical protein [Candidatus Hodarchaeaceae archaeon]
MREVLEFYLELSVDLGGYLSKRLDERGAFEGTVEELRRCNEDSLRAVTAAVGKLNQAKQNPGLLNFRYIAWDLMPMVREYAEQHVLQPEVLRELCERALLLIASPK